MRTYSLVCAAATLFFLADKSEAYKCYSCSGSHCIYTYDTANVHCSLGCQTIKTTTEKVSSFSRGCIPSADFTFAGCSNTNPQIKCNCYGDYCNYGYSPQSFGDFHPHSDSTLCYSCTNCRLTTSNTSTVVCPHGCATHLYKFAPDSRSGKNDIRGCIVATENKTYTGCVTVYDNATALYKETCLCNGNHCNRGREGSEIGKESHDASVFPRCHHCIPKSYFDTSCNKTSSGTYAHCRYGCRRYERKTVQTINHQSGKNNISFYTVQKDCATSAFTKEYCTDLPEESISSYSIIEITGTRSVCKMPLCNGNTGSRCNNLGIISGSTALVSGKQRLLVYPLVYFSIHISFKILLYGFPN